jgi:membrane protein
MGLVPFLKSLYQAHERDAVSTSAAALTYYFIFSLFPFLFFLVTLAAFLPLGGSVQTLFARLRPIMPHEAMGIVEQHIKALLHKPHPKLLTAGVAVSIYSASRGVNAFREGMNLAYGVKESRSYLHTQALAIAMTAGGALLVLIGVAAMIIGGDAGVWLARHLGLMSEWLLAWRWLRWPVIVFVLMIAVAVTYHLLPDVRHKFHLITAGSVIATLAWLLATWAFSAYVSHFGKYNVTYGSIGGVIILMTWLWMTGFIFLMGGEINAILAREHGAASPRAARRPEPTQPSPAEPASARPRPPRSGRHVPVT